MRVCVCVYTRRDVHCLTTPLPHNVGHVEAPTVVRHSSPQRGVGQRCPRTTYNATMWSVRWR